MKTASLSRRSAAKTEIFTTVMILATGLVTIASVRPLHSNNPKLKAAVEGALDVTNPTHAQMLNLTTLLAAGEGTTDLTGLEYATNLHDLYISGNQISNISPPAGVVGLVGWWKLDETDGDIAFDSAGLNDGVTYGNPAWQPTGGMLDGALQFDGGDDYVSLPIGPLISTLSDCTVTTWADWSGTGGYWQRIFDFGSGITSYMFLTPTGGTSLRFAIKKTGTGGESTLDAPSNLATGWHHIAVAINGTTKVMQLYIDGIATTTATTQTLPEELGITTQNRLGKSQYADPLYKGSLDDFRIYNCVLSEDEVRQVMLGEGDLPVADEILIGDFEQSMEGWGPTPANVLGGPAPTFSYSTTGATSGNNSLAVKPNKNGFQWSFMYSGIVDLEIYKKLSVDVTWIAAEWGTTPWCNFKEVVVNSDGPGGWKIYIPEDTVSLDWPGAWDPVNWGDHTRTLTWDFSDYDATGATWMQIIFSTNFGGSTPGNYYIDNVRLIGEEYVPGTMGGIAGWWKLDETSGTIAYDSAGENDGVLYGDPVWQPTAGEIDGALKFDGSNDYVDLPIGTLISSLTNSTFASWVNWSGIGTWIRIFDFGSGTNAYMFLTPCTDTGFMRFGITNAGNTAEDQATAPQVLATGWHHVAVTIDAASNTHLLYLDGQVIATKTSARYTPSSLGTTTQNWLGWSQWKGAIYFNGLLDDFRIYSQTLSSAEIMDLAQGAQSPTSQPVSPTTCPAIDTQCPAASTQCPAQTTQCPIGETQCPVNQSYCPTVETQCPPVETVCPVCPKATTGSINPTDCDTVTQFPAATECPEFPTQCPVAETLCPSKETECPVLPTACPYVATECDPPGMCWIPIPVVTRVPVNTQCSTSTKCPEVDTQCPTSSTKCPESSTHCPELSTWCPATETQCPIFPTFCPIISTLCPIVNTQCPLLPVETECPTIDTQCPEQNTQCPVKDTQCPVGFETKCTSDWQLCWWLTASQSVNQQHQEIVTRNTSGSLDGPDLTSNLQLIPDLYSWNLGGISFPQVKRVGTTPLPGPAKGLAGTTRINPDVAKCPIVHTQAPFVLDSAGH